jgi:hypothetical protein
MRKLEIIERIAEVLGECRLERWYAEQASVGLREKFRPGFQVTPMQDAANLDLSVLNGS